MDVFNSTFVYVINVGLNYFIHLVTYVIKQVYFPRIFWRGFKSQIYKGLI